MLRNLYKQKHKWYFICMEGGFDMIDKTIGERIRNRRTELGMLQSELAEKVGFKAHSTIALIENGERSLGIDKVKPMAKALNTTFAYIMGVEDEQDSDKNDPLSALSDSKKNLITEIVKEMAGMSQDELSEINNLINYIIFKRNN